MLGAAHLSAGHAQTFMPGQFSQSSNGSATYTIPIKVAPGTAELVPKLALVYDSQGGNGYLGVGWSISGLSSIERCPKTRLQDGSSGVIGMDANDRYCLDGAKLQAMNGAAYAANGTEYKTEFEYFSQIKSVAVSGVTTTLGPTKFVIKTKAGLIMEYGASTDSRVFGTTPKNTVVATWALSKVSDVKGNYIAFSYSAADTVNGQYYLSKIEHGSGGDASVKLGSMEFTYDQDGAGNAQVRPDIMVAYAGGSLFKRTVRLSKINVKDSVGTLLRKYDFGFELSKTTGRSLLNAISMTEGGSVVAKTNFTWNAETSGWTRNDAYLLPEFLSSDGQADIGRRLQDMNGDGLPDLVISRYAPTYTQQGMYYANKTGGWALQPVSANLPDFLSSDGLSDIGRRLIDLNGDGITDLLVSRYYGGSIQMVAYLGTVTGWQVSPGYKPPMLFNSDEIGDLGCRLLDVNLDGLPDLACARYFSDGHVEKGTWLNTGSGWNKSEKYTLPDIISADGYKSLGREFIDINGDGAPDLVVSRHIPPSSSEKAVYLNTPDGWVSAPQYILPDFLSSGSLSDIGRRFADVNGDGLPDLLVGRYSGNGGSPYTQMAAYLNTGAGWVSAPQYTPPLIFAADNMGDMGARLLDVNLDGLPDFLFGRLQSDGVVVWGAWLNNGNGWTKTPAYDLPVIVAADGHATLGREFTDVNGDGSPDFIYSRHMPPSSSEKGTYLNNSVGDRIVSIGTELVPNALSFSYSTQKMQLGNQYLRDVPNAYPIVVAAESIPILTSMSEPNGVGGYRVRKFSYGNMRVELGEMGRGSLGYQWTQAQDVFTGLVSRTYYRQDFPYIGMVDKVGRGTSEANWSNLGMTTNEYKFMAYLPSDTGYASGVTCGDDAATGKTVASCAASAIKPLSRYVPYLAKSANKAWDWDSTANVFTALQQSRTTTVLDSWGNATQVKAETLNADGTDSGFSKTTNSTFAPADTANWRLGRLTKSSVTASAP